MNAVLDASAFAPVVLADERATLHTVLTELLAGPGVVVPQHWRIEVANMILVASRRGRLSSEGLRGALDTVEAVIVEVDPATAGQLFETTWTLAERHQLTIYDAAYLELALRLDLPLASHDARLNAAANKESLPLFAR